MEITERKLSEIINKHCSCGGRGPDDDPCPACAVYHDIYNFQEVLQVREYSEETK